MDIQEYLKKYANTPSEVADFARAAGMSPMYLSHIVNRHKNPGIEKIIGLIRASNGRIKLEAIRPDLFDKDTKRLIRKAAA